MVFLVKTSVRAYNKRVQNELIKSFAKQRNHFVPLLICFVYDRALIKTFQSITSWCFLVLN